MRARLTPRDAPEPAVIDAAWARYSAALTALDANPLSWPGRRRWLNAIRRLRAVDPGFRHRPAAK
jgi:hypothetical protein